MTNASVKNSLFVLSVVAVAAALSLGAFAMTAHAEGFSDYGDFGGGGWSDYGGYDAGWSDYGSYTPDYSDYGNYGGWSDYGSYGYDVAAPESYNVSAPESYDVAAPYGYDVAAPQGYDVAAPEYGYESYDVYDTYGYDTSYSSGVSSALNYARTFVPPQYQSYIPTYSQPQRPVYYPVQQQQQQQQQQGGQPINIVNNNVNTNTNTNVAPVSQATPQPIVQYVYPQNYSYPTYYPNYQPTYQQAPYCYITATTGVNGLVYLTWSSTNATTAYITPSIGSVAPYGSTSLYTYGNRVYTMTVSGPGGTQTCSTQVYTTTPTTPYVSLSQIPYTGFDFGPVGNAIYWLSLISLAIAGAYLLVYFRGGAVQLIGLTFPKKQAVIAHAAPVAHAPVQMQPVAVASVLESLPTGSSNSTKDTMKIMETNGVPRIVIARV